MRNKKRLTPFVLAVPVLMLIIVLGGIYASKSTLTSSKVPWLATNSTDQNAPWKTYTNKYFHYQISIPSDWTIEDPFEPTRFPSVRLSSANKEISIIEPSDVGFKGIDDLPILKSKPISSPNVQLGQFLVRRQLPQVENDKNGIFDDDYLDTSNVPNPQHYHLPMFRLIINGDFTKNNALVLQILRTFHNTQPEAEIGSFITYSVPKGWVDKSDFDQILLQSPNLQAGEYFGIKQGMAIGISKQFNTPGRSIQTYKNQFTGATIFHNIVDTTIDGIPGVSYRTIGEGTYALNFDVIKDDIIWSIRFDSSGPGDEQKYLNLIAVFIKSFHFKQ